MSGAVLFQVAFAFALTAIFTWLLKSPAGKYGLIDDPGSRKRHLGKVPLVGGLGMCLAFSLTLLILFPSVTRHEGFLLLGGYMLMLTGLVDDLRDVSVSLRFTLQIVAVLIITLTGGINLENLGDLAGSGDIHMGILTIPFTIFCVVGIINAMNMIDGLDGLAGCIAIVALAFLSLAAGANGMLIEMSTLFILIGCVGGFLIYNLRSPWRAKATVFMGDSGSMFLGFVLAWFAMDLSRGGTRAIDPIAAVWILGLLILDTIYVMLQRSFRGESPFRSGRDHLHYVLLDSGLSVQKTVWLMTGISAALGTVGMLGTRLQWGEPVLFYLFLTSSGVYCVFRQLLERSVARRALARP